MEETTDKKGEKPKGKPFPKYNPNKKVKTPKKKYRKKLTQQQKDYVYYLIKGNTQGKAAILAGYSPKQPSSQSSNLMRNPRIIAEIARLRSNLSSNLNITKETLLLDLEKIKNRGMEGERFYDDEGNIVDIIPRDDKVAIAAIQTQSKLIGIGGYARAEIKSNVNIDARVQIKSSNTYDLESLTREERKQLVGLLAKARITQEKKDNLERSKKRQSTIDKREEEKLLNPPKEEVIDVDSNEVLE